MNECPIYVYMQAGKVRAALASESKLDAEQPPSRRGTVNARFAGLEDLPRPASPLLE
jgi:hypothetical protein